MSKPASKEMVDAAIGEASPEEPFSPDDDSDYVAEGEQKSKEYVNSPVGSLEWQRRAVFLDE